MWSTKDIKDLMILTGLIGTIVGAVGVAAYTMKKEIEALKSKKGA